MGTLGVRDDQLACRSVFKDFTEGALTILAGSLFLNGTARMVKENWRHPCWWVGCMKVDFMGNSRFNVAF